MVIHIVCLTQRAEEHVFDKKIEARRCGAVSVSVCLLQAACLLVASVVHTVGCVHALCGLCLLSLVELASLCLRGVWAYAWLHFLSSLCWARGCACGSAL